MQYIEDQLHNAGIVVPLVNNDVGPDGNNAPGTGVGEVDIYVSAIWVVLLAIHVHLLIYLDVAGTVSDTPLPVQAGCNLVTLRTAEQVYKLCQSLADLVIT